MGQVSSFYYYLFKILPYEMEDYVVIKFCFCFFDSWGPSEDAGRSKGGSVACVLGMRKF